MTLRQTATETVDEYSLRFQRLLRKVETNQALPEPMKIWMYLFGLNPLLTPIVAAGRPGTVDAAMDGARTVKTGYNYVPTKDVSLKVLPTAQVNPLPQPVEQPKAAVPDVDALTE